MAKDAGPSVEGRRAARKILEKFGTAHDSWVEFGAEIIDESHRELRECLRELAGHLQHSHNPMARCGKTNTNCMGCIWRARASKVLGEK